MPLGFGAIGRLPIGGIPPSDAPAPGIGSSIGGGTFSRKRWHAMLAAAQAERAAQMRRDRDDRLRRTAERRRREASFAAARERARIDAKAQGDAAAAALAELHAAAAAR